MGVITAENLTYVYSKGTPFERVAIENFSIDIEDGEFVGLIGHTGSGKSTFVRHLNGLIKPDSGRVLFEGKDIWSGEVDIREVRFKVGLVFQYPEQQLFEETVEKDIGFGPKNMGLHEDEIAAAVREAMGLVGLGEEFLSKSPFELSGGEKRRVAIAGVLAMRPRVLILDEPTAGLDPRGRIELLSEIAKYRERTGGTVIFVSHSMEDIARTAEKVLVVNRGAPYMFGTVKEVFDRADELESIGLSVPEITKVFSVLADRGIPVSRSVYTVEDGVAEILRVAGERGGPDA